jgi:hypothetical protein
MIPTGGFMDSLLEFEVSSVDRVFIRRQSRNHSPPTAQPKLTGLPLPTMLAAGHA